MKGQSTTICWCVDVKRQKIKKVTLELSAVDV